MSIGVEPLVALIEKNDGNSPPVATRINAIALQTELDWFSRVLDARMQLYFVQETNIGEVREVVPPILEDDNSDYGSLVVDLCLGFDERLLLMLAMIPHLRPQALDTLFLHNKNLGRTYTEFGGLAGKNHGGFLPSCETAAFLLAGDDLARRFEVLQLFDPEHRLYSCEILRIVHSTGAESALNGALQITPAALSQLTTGVAHKPDFSADFPAKRLTTALSWDDLVLPANVLDEVENILAWLRHEEVILNDWGLKKSLKPGYRSLFYGPPGTGKTLTASLLGQSCNRDVYRIDLSMVVSKYIGETEKNLAGVFDQARNKHWILFFDEADALFGKRTQTSSSNDRHANQEVSYLLQRVEDFPGVVILATNLKSNIDEAFSRRFQSQIYFPTPDEAERLRLWEVVLAGRQRLGSDVDLQSIAENYTLSGGAMTNVVRDAVISAMRRGQSQITQNDLLTGITKELRKEGKNI